MAQHGVIYIISNKIRDGEEKFKVGKTYDLERRLTELNGETSNFGEFKKVAFFPVSDMVKAESEVHEGLQRFRIARNREFFQGNQSEITNIVQSITSKYRPKDFISKLVVHEYTDKYKSWLLLAQQGDATAQFNLGVINENGQGVPTNYQEAAKWYRLSAEQGHSSAQSKLGFMYYNGQGVPLDFALAHMWFNLSGSNGHKGAVKNRKIAEKKMTKQQIEKAQEMARNWKPTKK